MTEKKTDDKLFEAMFSYVPIERIVLRLPAKDIEDAKEKILGKKNDQIRDLIIEDIKEVTELTPTPPGYMSIEDLRLLYETEDMDINTPVIDDKITLN